MQKPIQFILVGFPFAGKTTLATELEKRLGFARINLDEVKFEHGYEGISDDDVPDKAWGEIFQDANKRLINYLKAGKSVLNETAWTTREWRDKARRVALDAGFQTKIIYLEIPEEITRERWLKNRKTKQRFDVPDNVFEESIRTFEIPGEEENIIVFDQNTSLDKWVERYF
ncbi:MAG: ATP-binding protein [Patescibacteria group bacterium]|nr:ATP-binding protein [Patescibacteria group bacterium]